MTSVEEHRIAVCTAGVGRIYAMLQDSSSEWRNYLNLARSVTRALDQTGFMLDPTRRDEQAWVVESIQELAYVDADSGGDYELAEWCQAQWLTLLQQDPNQLRALRGLGFHWLKKAQPHLAIVHVEDRSSSSAASNGRPTTTELPYSQADDDADALRAANEAEDRVQTAHYVEARGLLVPATDFFARAVEVADEEDGVTGELLVLASEACMSLGNVSFLREAHHHFERCLDYLIRARDLPGFDLAPYLSRFLDDYGRLVA